MSSAGNARSAAYNDRRTAATSGAKPRAPSARADVRERPDSRGELFPQDSASNAGSGSRRAPPAAHKASGSIGGTREGRTEKTHITTRDTLQVRIKSPERRPKGSNDEDRQRPPKEDDPFRSESRATGRRVPPPKKEKESRRQSSSVLVTPILG